ncbi:hypothetical protein KAI87_01895 [Myxococcota bacterium]|nr:hypothetical protein [Myxococcota bacterium]
MQIVTGAAQDLIIGLQNEDNASAAQELKSALKTLKTTYPKGYELLVNEQRYPSLTDAELAQKMDISKDNLYQIRKRQKRILRESRRRANRLQRISPA